MIAAVAAVAAALGADAAQAGTYDVWSCRAPDGSPSVVRDEGGGWISSTNSPDEGGTSYLADECGAGGGLDATHTQTGSQSTRSSVVWAFTAPDGTSISDYVVAMSGRAQGRRDGHGTARGYVGIRDTRQTTPDTWSFRAEGEAYSQFNTGDVSVLPFVRTFNAAGGTRIEVAAGCVGADDERCFADRYGAAAQATVTRSTITLQDRDAPLVTSVAGEAATASTWSRGPIGVTLAATDRGGGVLRAAVEIDGQPQSWVPAAAAPCRIWPGTDRSFVTPKPCPGNVSLTLPVATAELADGDHTMRVLVEDAAGNQTAAYGPVTKTIGPASSGGSGSGGNGGPGSGSGDAGSPSNQTGPGGDIQSAGGAGGNVLADPGPLNGRPAVATARLNARWEGSESPFKMVRFSQRPVLGGQLTAGDGQPIRGAAIRVKITREHRNAGQVEHRSLETDDRGSFRWRLPAGLSSRRIELSYHLHVGDVAAAATRTLQLRVPAGLTLKLSRNRVHQGQTVKLSGKLLGRPIPRVGKVIELQARNPGRQWITFRTVRAKHSGGFSSVYRFRRPGPATFEMRARARKSGDYPYATGASPGRRIVVR